MPDILKIMLSSSVYHFEEQIEQIASVLQTYGYHVLNSHVGTIRVGPHQHNFEACRQAVEECDIFFGIIRGQYGSGRLGRTGLADNEISVTHSELRHAIRLNKPRLFLVESSVEIARQVLKPLRLNLNQALFDPQQQQVWDPTGSPFRHNPVLDDIRVLDMYDEALQADTPLPQRQDHWCRPYKRLTDILRFVEAQFEDQARLRADLHTALATTDRGN